MKIIAFTAENVKKLRVVNLRPESDLILVTGRNGSGKSSVLDAIYYCLAGKDAICEKPIHEGEERARIKLDLGEIVVERKFTAHGTTLTVESADGLAYKSPQTLLDSLIGQMAFDPLEFSRMKPREQFDALRQSCSVNYDFEKSAQLDAQDTEQRRIANRDFKALQSQIAGLGAVPASVPDRVNVEEMLTELNRIAAHNKRVDADKNEMNSAMNDCGKLCAEIEKTQELLAKLRGQLDTKMAYVSANENNKYEKLDASPIEKQIAEASAIDKIRNKFEAMEKLKIDAKKYERLAAKYDKLLRERAEERRKVLESATMPAKGLTLAEGSVLLYGQPFSQASSAEQLRASIAIAMAANPKLRIIRIKDGSLLDDDGLDILAEMTANGDYQVWCERVDSSGKVGIVMEDGEVKINHYENDE